jgi:hypothetical protein
LKKSRKNYNSIAKDWWSAPLNGRLDLWRQNCKTRGGQLRNASGFLYCTMDSVNSRITARYLMETAATVMKKQNNR